MWTYSGNPASSPKDRIRFDLGDTDDKDQLIQDEEIEFCISMEPTLAGALARAAEHIWQQMLKQISINVSGFNLDLKSRAEAWGKRAQELRAKATQVTPSLPSAGGLDESEEEGMYFRLGQHDY